MFVQMRTMLKVASMELLVRESGSGEESSTINSQLSLVYLVMIRVVVFLSKFFLMMEMVHCCSCLEGACGPR